MSAKLRTPGTSRCEAAGSSGAGGKTKPCAGTDGVSLPTGESTQ
jgi:hypothetical protein